MRQTRPFSLPLYLLIVFGLSWPFQIASAIWANQQLLLRFILNASAMVMVTVGTYIAGRYIFRDGFANAGWRWGKPWHYLTVIGLALLLYAVPTPIDLAFGNVKLPAAITTEQVTWLFTFFVVGLLPSFGEEFGWRGYMWPRIAQRYSIRRAALLQGLIWWFWHLPVVIGGAILAGLLGARQTGTSVEFMVTISVLTVVVLSALPVVLHGVIMAYIWTRTQSLAASTVYHTAHNGVRDSISLITGLGSIAGLWANLLIVVLGLFCLWKGDWSNLKSATPSPTMERETTPSPL